MTTGAGLDSLGYGYWNKWLDNWSRASLSRAKSKELVTQWMGHQNMVSPPGLLADVAGHNVTSKTRDLPIIICMHERLGSDTVSSEFPQKESPKPVYRIWGRFGANFVMKLLGYSNLTPFSQSQHLGLQVVPYPFFGIPLFWSPKSWLHYTLAVS